MNDDEELEVTDELTGLLSWAGLKKVMKDLGRRAGDGEERVGVICADADHFKKLNDSYGHRHGDRILTEIAQRVTGATPEGSNIARLSQDEFVVLLPTAKDISDVQQAAVSILRAFDNPVEIEGDFVDVRLSLGVAFVQSENVREHLRDAETAVYDAKHRGGAWAVCLEPEWAVQ